MIEKSMLCNTDTYKEQVDKLISAICPTTLLEEFASQVGRFTCDNGKLMFKIISRVLFFIIISSRDLCIYFSNKKKL